MKNLTSLERVMNAIELQEVDRTPIIPQLTYATAHFLNMGIDECLEDIEKQKVALGNSQKLCGYDGIYAGWEGSFVLITSSLGAPLKIYPDRPPIIEKPLITSRNDLENLIELNLGRFTKMGRIPLSMQLITDLKASIYNVPILSYIPGPFTLGGLFLGLTEFLIALIRDKLNIMEDLLHYAYQVTLTFATAKIKAGVDMITIAEPSGSTDLVSPKLFEQYSFPLLKELIAKLKESGIKVGLHICGQTKPILEKMAKTGADYLEIDAKVDLVEAQKLLDGKICLVGNISPTSLLMKTSQYIKQKCKELLKKMRQGFILSSGCEVAYSSPIENIKAMWHAAVEVFKNQ
ncbi:MAG: uroporphyrinogen decarboxylase family protein [Promethearchaeota archaeon]